MKKFLTITGLLSKRVLKMPIIIILLVLIPVASLAISLVASKSKSAEVHFGIYFEDRGDYGAIIKERLMTGDDAFFFIEYEDEEAMKLDVTRGKLEAGYVFDKHFTDNIRAGEYKHCLKTYISPSTLMSSAGNEIIFSNIMQLCGYTIIGEYIKSSSLDEDGKASASADLVTSYEAYCSSGQIFHLDIETASGVNVNNQGLNDIGVTFPLRGILSILIFLAALTGSVAWLKDKEQGIFAPRSHSFMVISQILYPLIPALLFLICSQLALAICHMGRPVMTELLIGTRYLLILTVFCYLCSAILKKSHLMISLIPVLTLGSLIFCPIFVNIETLIPALGVVSKLFVPRYYL